MLTPRTPHSRPAGSSRLYLVSIFTAWTAFVFTFCPNVRAAASPAISVTEALPTLLQRGSAAFAAGDYAAAAEAFSRVERDFGDETAWTDGTLPRRLLPLRGFAELRSGMPAEASDSLASFLHDFPEEANQRSFVLYSLALALRETGRLEEALKRFTSFENENPDSAQSALARFQRAEILFELNRFEEALQVLRDLGGNEGVSDSLRVQARLRALQKAVELEQNQIAAGLLFDEPWAVSTMPEIAVLAFAAMELGDRFMADQQSAEAIRAYRFVLPKERLVEAQRARLEELRAVFAERAPSVSPDSGSFWIDFYQGRIARIAEQLRGLEESEDYTIPLQLRIGQAYLLGERHREAWLFFERIAVHEELPEEWRQPAHYRWILAASGLERWEDALTIARTFVERFPESDLAPEAFYLIARAHLEQRRFVEAEEVFSDILARFPNADSAGRALFTRGWARVMLEHYEAARSDFDRYSVEFPNGPLGVNAQLWRALTFFFEKNYDEALPAFDQLVELHPTHPLLPEILYRRATTLYAMRDFERAREEMESFVASYGAHPRHPEALVLLGDILMGAGELSAAKKTFESVPSEASASFVYAVFQVGKILRAEGDHDGMVNHFTGYATRTDLAAQPRVSEALYWVGWAEEQRGDPAAAVPVFLGVLERFGNNPGAGEVGSTLSALDRLVQKMDSEIPSGEIDPRALPLITGTMDAWVDSERLRARDDEMFTLYSRLTIYRADQHAKAKQPYQEEALLLEIAATAPLESLDANALAQVGLALQEIGSEDCVNYFNRLLDEFPASFDRATAYYGLARDALKHREFSSAFSWLRQFDNETPTHPLSPQASLLNAQTLEEEGQIDAALEAYEGILRLKSARGRPHAEALIGLARCSEKRGDVTRAIAYHQRVFTMYRAYDDLAAVGYVDSARLFESLGDLQAAANTYSEFLGTPRIGDAALREDARLQLDRVQSLLATTPLNIP